MIEEKLSEYLYKVMENLDDWLSGTYSQPEIYLRLSETFYYPEPRPFRQIRNWRLRKPTYVFIPDLRQNNRKRFAHHHWSKAPPATDMVCRCCRTKTTSFLVHFLNRKRVAPKGSSRHGGMGIAPNSNFSFRLL